MYSFGYLKSQEVFLTRSTSQRMTSNATRMGILKMVELEGFAEKNPNRMRILKMQESSNVECFVK